MTVDIKAAVELATRWRARNLLEIAALDVDDDKPKRITLADEGDLQLLTDALIALAPVVEAAQAWLATEQAPWRSLGGHLGDSNCSAGECDVDCPARVQREQLEQAVDALNGGK